MPDDFARQTLAEREVRLQSDGPAKAKTDVRGNHDLADRIRVKGWAHDRLAPDRRVQLVVLCNGAVIARVTADRYRADLEKAGMGDGRHAFEVLLTEDLPTDRQVDIEVRAADDGRLLSGSPKFIEAKSSAAAQTEPRSPEVQGALGGSLDVVSHIRIRGWVQNPAQPLRPVALVISANGKRIGRVLANRFRADLKKAGVGEGRHGFDFVIPGGLSRAEAHTIRVQCEADALDMPGSPGLLPAASAYDPTIETVLADILDKTASPEDEEKALALLTQQTERLLARRAERMGGRSEREALRMFQRRWGSAGVEGAAALGADALAPRALVIDDRLPSLGRDAGSVAILSHVRALKALGYAVTFAAYDGARSDAAVDQLAQAEGFTICSKPHYSDVEDVLLRHAGSFEIVYLHRITTVERYLKLVRAHMRKARMIYSVADLHHVRLARQADVEARPELLSNARAMARAEMLAASQSDLVFTHSPFEAALLATRLNPDSVKVVPFAVEARQSLPPFADRRGIAFLGSSGHAPNPDAVHWLASEIMPLVWAQAPDLTCKIAGHGWQAGSFGGLDPRMEIVGSVANLDDLFGAVRLTVAPLRFGAGVKGKVLDSFAAGLPCVMSEIAAEGLPLPGALAGLVGRDAAKLAALILQFHEDEALNVACGSQAKALVAEQFSQDRVTDCIRAALFGASDHASLAPAPA